MVMGPRYSYERVLRDSQKYAKQSEGGKFCAWWEPYLRDEGFRAAYRPVLDLYGLKRFKGRVVGLLVMDVPHLKVAHIVAADELGVVDPADGAPDHIEIAEYVLSRRAQGVNFHAEFLAVERASKLLRTVRRLR
jgi:hypothetical protein